MKRYWFCLNSCQWSEMLLNKPEVFCQGTIPEKTVFQGSVAKHAKFYRSQFLCKQMFVFFSLLQSARTPVFFQSCLHSSAGRIQAGNTIPSQLMGICLLGWYSHWPFINSEDNSPRGLSVSTQTLQSQYSISFNVKLTFYWKALAALGSHEGYSCHQCVINHLFYREGWKQIKVSTRLLSLSIVVLVTAFLCFLLKCQTGTVEIAAFPVCEAEYFCPWK